MAPPSVLHEIPFSLTPAELSLQKMVTDLYQILEGAGPQSLIATALRRRLESSLAALESILRGLAEGAQDRFDGTPESVEEEAAHEMRAYRMDRSTAEKAAAAVGHALQQIEAIATDSKLGAFGLALNHIKRVGKPSRRICVLTDYLTTLYYLAAEIEGKDISYYLLHGAMSADDRRRSLKLFRNKGELLLATRAVLIEDACLSEVTDLVLYDGPDSEATLRQVLARFDRFGRVDQLCVHVFTSSNGFEGLAAKRLGIIRSVLG